MVREAEKGPGQTRDAQGGKGQLALRCVHSGPRLVAVARVNVAGGGCLGVPVAWGVALEAPRPRARSQKA